MFDIFTEQAKSVLAAARKIAGEYGINEYDTQNPEGLIDTEHLLYGLFEQAPNVSKYLISQKLYQANPDFMQSIIRGPHMAGEQILEEVKKILHRSSRPIPESRDIPASEGFKTVLKVVFQEATRETTMVKPEHILLGLVIESKGAAAKFLKELYFADAKGIRDTIVYSNALKAERTASRPSDRTQIQTTDDPAGTKPG